MFWDFHLPWNTENSNLLLVCLVTSFKLAFSSPPLLTKSMKMKYWLPWNEKGNIRENYCHYSYLFGSSVPCAVSATLTFQNWTHKLYQTSATPTSLSVTTNNSFYGKPGNTRIFVERWWWCFLLGLFSNMDFMLYLPHKVTNCTSSSTNLPFSCLFTSYQTSFKLLIKQIPLWLQKISVLQFHIAGQRVQSLFQKHSQYNTTGMKKEAISTFQ